MTDKKYDKLASELTSCIGCFFRTPPLEKSQKMFFKEIIKAEIKKLDPWILIETYFRDNPNYKTQHQTDSFNEFI